MFEGGLLPANAVAVTVGSAKVSQCFHANNAVTQTSCKSNAFTQAVMTTHGAYRFLRSCFEIGTRDWTGCRAVSEMNFQELLS